MRAGSDEAEARAPACGRCGAPLPLDLLHASVRCRHCGEETRVDEGLRGRMRRYLGDTARAVRDEMEARWQEAFYAQNEQAARSFLIGAVGVALAVTGGFLVMLGGPSGRLPLLLFVALLALWAGSLALFTRGWCVMNDVPTPRRLASIRVARCAGCGATSGFRGSEATVRCKFCKNTLLVPSELASSLLGETRERAAQASVAREDALSRATRAGDRLVNPLVAVVLIVVTAAVVGVLVLDVKAGPEVPSLLFFVLFLALPVPAVRRMARALREIAAARRAFEASITSLSGQLAAPRSPG